MAYSLAVDMGTTFTAAAVSDGSAPTMIGLGNRALQIPSVLFWTGEEFLVGEAAERRGTADPKHVVREFKRRLGDQVPLLVDGSPFSAELLTARLLQWVVASTARQLGGAHSRLTVTHPANWGDYKMEVFGQVMALADVHDVHCVAEPVAAAAQYASRSRVDTGSKLAMYDLGGGTFDICVVEKTPGGFDILGYPQGIEHLGGTDLDETMFELVTESLGDRLDDIDPNDPATVIGLGRLRRDCVDAKESLSTDVDTIVPVSLPGVSKTVRVTRGEFEARIRPPVDVTLAAMHRALASASVQPADLAAVVLVGGSSRIPLIGELIQHEFGVPLALDTHPKHDVALGAARLQGLRTLPAGSPRPQPSVSNPPVPTVPVASAATTPVTPGPTGPLPPVAATPVAPAPTSPQTPVPPRIERPHPVRTQPRTPQPGQRQTERPNVDHPNRRRPLPGRRVPALQVDNTAAIHGSARKAGAAAPDRAPRRSRKLGALIAVGALTVSAVVVAVGQFRDRDLELIGAPSGAGTAAATGTPTATPAPSASPSGRTTPTSPTTAPTPQAPRLPRAAAPLPTDQLLWTRYRGSDSDIWRTRIDGEKAALLTPGSGSATRPVLSPDRRSFIYVHDKGGKRRLRVMGIDGTGDRRLFAKGPFAKLDLGRPGWSPDGTKIASAWQVDDTHENLVVLSLDGSRIETVAKVREMSDPTFTPDGLSVSYWANRRNGAESGTLMIVPADGSAPPRPVLATTSDQDADPAWSPNGSLLAFRRAEKKDWNIWVADRNGKGLRRLTKARGRDQDPEWSPDGTRIVFRSERDGDPDLFVMNADGSKQRLVASRRGDDGKPSWNRR